MGKIAWKILAFYKIKYKETKKIYKYLLKIKLVY